MTNNLKKVLIIVGPTATGKTDVSIEVAKMLNGEIISADSMLVYKGMDIGTAKPTKEEMQGIPHYMIDVVGPNQEFSVAMYQSAVEKLIEDISGRGKLPILVGGTGLYIRAVIDEYNFNSADRDEQLRQKLSEEAELLGPLEMHRRLAEIDPESAQRLHPNDVRRVIRSLEVYYQTGVPQSKQSNRNNSGVGKYNHKMFGLTMDRQLLYKRIELRVDLMLERGLVQEVKDLMERYDSWGTALQGLGYKEIISYLKDECSLEEAVELLKRNTRRFAKRQLTWFKADKRIEWLDLGDFYSKREVASEIAKQIAGE